MRQIQHVGRLFRQAEHAIAQEIHKHHESLGITTSQGYLLMYLSHRVLAGDTPIYAKDVEQDLGLRHSSISGVLQRLEAKGFLFFETDDGDRRCKKIVLTEKAMEIRHKIEDNIRKTEERIFRGMTPQEEAEFFRLLQKATENLTEGKAEPHPPFCTEQEEDAL